MAATARAYLWLKMLEATSSGHPLTPAECHKLAPRYRYTSTELSHLEEQEMATRTKDGRYYVADDAVVPRGLTLNELGDALRARERNRQSSD